MSNDTFIRLTRIEASAHEVFSWHTRLGALERLMPPWIRVEVVKRDEGICDGGRVELRLRRGPFTIPWIVERRDCVLDSQFRDIQLKGPFACWEHTHRFEADGAACHIQDRIEYRVPLGALGRMLADRYVQDELDRLFMYRHRILTHDISVHRAYAGVRPMRILVTGASGLVGTSLVPFLTSGGHSVTRLARGTSAGSNTVVWDPERGQIDPASLEGFDGVVHLAGESLQSLHWSREKKRRIRESRLAGTRLLAETLARLQSPPRVLVSASAIGYYGNRGAETLDEESGSGSGFLAGLCREWEAATQPAADRGIRVVTPRFGVILSPAGGALKAMLPAFRLGVGGPFGGGYQYMSWVTIDDALEAIYHALLTETLRGPVNVVSPHAATNKDFAATLGMILNRPVFLGVPAFAARLVMGEAAEELLLSSARIEPRRLLETGYLYRFPDLEGALRHVLGRN